MECDISTLIPQVLIIAFSKHNLIAFAKSISQSKMQVAGHFTSVILKVNFTCVYAKQRKSYILLGSVVSFPQLHVWE